MKTTQKSALITALVLLIAAVYAGSSSCLYCRRMDRNAGFLVSYSYCN